MACVRLLTFRLDCFWEFGRGPVYFTDFGCRGQWQSPSRGPAVLTMGRAGYYIALFFEVGLPEVTSADSLTQVFFRNVRGVIERT